MAAQVFKDGKSQFVEPEALPGYFALGWSVVDPNAPLPQGVAILNKKPHGQPAYIIHDSLKS